MDRGKNIIQEESANFSSYPMMSNYQHGSENLLLDRGIQQHFPAFTSPFDAAPASSIPHMDWNPATMLDNLTFIEEKIRQVKNGIRSMVGNGVQLSTEPWELMQQHVNADLTCLIVQLISTAGSLLPSLKNSSFLSHPPAAAGGQMGNLAGTSSSLDPAYKSHAALAKPPRDASVDQDAVVKRYSCPFAGCKRNKLHRSFLPLKTILCVKNHYKRSHCEKSHTCSRCHAKKFSIMADLKTHEKHCGQIKWLCSCGTSFTRKDKLFSHVGLFKGHMPSLPPADEPEAADQAARAGGHQEPAKDEISMGWGNSSGNGVEHLGVNVLDSCSDFFLSATNFGSFDFGLGQVSGYPEYHSEGSFRMLPPDQDHDQSAEKKGES